MRLSGPLIMATNNDLFTMEIGLALFQTTFKRRSWRGCGRIAVLGDAHCNRVLYLSQADYGEYCHDGHEGLRGLLLRFDAGLQQQPCVHY